MILEYLSDVALLLENGKAKIYAHKFFLMTASPVFHQVFAEEPDAADVKIPHISKETMVEVCRFAYTDNLRLTQNNMLKVLAAATHLQMKFLAEKAIGFISKEGLNVSTVFTVLEANQEDKNMLLSMTCFKFIEKNHQKVFKSPEFLKLPYETLTLMLQTCKIPQVALKEAVAKWSAHPDNPTEDLDELIALISLNDYPEEVVKENVDNSHISDSDSVTSKGSRARSARGQGRNRGGMNGPNQMRGNFNQFNPNQHQQRQPPPNRPQHFNGPPPTRINTNGMKFLALQGRIVHKQFQYANLNFMTFKTPIMITEINFVNDLSTTDRDLKIWVADVSKKDKVDLFYDEINTSSNKINGEFRRYVLPRPCAVPADCKIWITFAFNRAEHRMSIDNATEDRSSSRDLVTLRNDTGTATSAQIVSHLFFKEN